MQLYDIIIAGGGVSGICAAAAAARSGASALVLEQTNCLGGTWTSGLVSWMLDINNKKGFILNEIIESLQSEQNGRFARGGSFIFESEAMKRLLDKMAERENIDLRFQTFVCGVGKTDNHINYVEAVSKSGLERFFGKCFIDSTGDGDLCALAGAEFETGNEQGIMQPMSMFAIVDGLDKDELCEFDNSLEYEDENNTPKDKLYSEIKRAGVSCSQQQPALYYLSNNRFLLTANHQYKVSGTSSGDLTRATLSARREIGEVVNSLRRLGGRWKNIRLVSTAPSIGVREGRRIKGEYTVTAEDIYAERKFDDSICDVSFVIDVHALEKENEKGYDDYGDDTERDYQIPLRSAICKGFDNLYMTGRCISGDFSAHGSYRVTGYAAVIGENVGKAAEKSLKKISGD